MSSVEFPFATSPAAYRLTLAGLIELLGEDPPKTVIPGHGPPLAAEEALGVAETTVRTHLGRLFDKTGTGRQADLVKLGAGFCNPLVG